MPNVHTNACLKNNADTLTSSLLQVEISKDMAELNHLNTSVFIALFATLNLTLSMRLCFMQVLRLYAQTSNALVATRKTPPAQVACDAHCKCTCVS